MLKITKEQLLQENAILKKEIFHLQDKVSRMSNTIDTFKKLLKD